MNLSFLVSFLDEDLTSSFDFDSSIFVQPITSLARDYARFCPVVKDSSTETFFLGLGQGTVNFGFSSFFL